MSKKKKNNFITKFFEKSEVLNKTSLSVKIKLCHCTWKRQEIKAGKKEQ